MKVAILVFIIYCNSVCVLLLGAPLNCSEVPQYAFSPYILKSQNLEVHVIPFGGAVTHILYPDRDGVQRDLVLGFQDPTLYCSSPIHPYFSVLIGRYANRIADGTFQLDGQTYHTPLNENGWDTLHGGTQGFDLHVWKVSQYDKSSITLSYFSPDGEMGFPGNLWVTVKYAVTDDEWSIDYSAYTDTETVINLSHHTYWNLNGFANNSQTILDHILTIDADTYLEVDGHLIPTGILGSVEQDYWLNFNNPKPVGKDIRYGTVTPQGGYDNAFVLSNPNNGATPCVTLTAPQTGITIQLYTNKPSVQFYSGNFLNNSIPRKNDQIYNNAQDQYYAQYSTVVFEAQDYPDAVNNPNFPSTVLKKGDTYSQHTSYTFSNK